MKTVRALAPSDRRCADAQDCIDLPLPEARFQAVLELFGAWYWEQDEQFRFTWIEGSGHGNADFDLGQYLGKTLWQTGIAPASAGAQWEGHLATLKARRPFADLLLRLAGPRGQRRYLRASGQPIFDRAARFSGYRGTALDVTRVVRDDQLLRLEHQVARCLAEASDASAALKAVIQAICETQEWLCGRYFRVDSGCELLRFSESWHVPDLELGRFIERSRDLVFERGTGLNGRVWDSGEPLWVSDQSADSRVRFRDLHRDASTRSAFLFPVTVEGKTVGVLGFASREIREPDERLLGMAKVIGSQVGQFLQRKRAEASLKRSNRILQVIGAISQALIQGDEQCRLVDTVCKLLVDSGGYRLAWIGFVGANDSVPIRLAAQSGMEPGALAGDSDIQPHRDPALTAVRTGTLQVCRNIFADLDLAGLHPHALAFGYASCLFAPLVDETGVIGVLSVASADAESFDADEVSLLQEVAAKLSFGIALHRSNVEHERAVARADRLALFDALTELPNRLQLLQDVTFMAQQSRLDSSGFSVLAIDVPRIETLKGSLGFGASDVLVMTLAARLKEICSEQEVAARLEGSEFAIRLDPESSANADAALARARAIRAALEVPCLIGATEVMPHCVIGIAMYPADGKDGQTLLERAQTARMSTSRGWSGDISFFGAQKSTQVMRELGLESALRQAIGADELRLVYQPEVDLGTGEIVSVEALVRWQSGQFGDVPPSEFIPLAERSTLILSIGEWVLRQACRQAAAWRAAGLAAPRIAVNLSSRQLEQPGFAAQVQAIALECGADPCWLGLEITESMLIEDDDYVSDVLRQLKAIGFQLLLDDFGTGYSSLSRLQAMPIDIVKIDRKFIPDVTAAPEEVSVTRAVITMAHSLQMRVLAEGVETEGQLSLLAAHGCDLIQGYFFSRPVPAAAIEAMVREHRRLPEKFLTRSAGGRTLLLVDDEENILSSLRRLLRRDGYQIICARSAAEGLQRLAESQVDVIVSDQRMPAMTGVEFLRRAKDLYPDTVRMVLSGFTDLQSIIDAVNEGAIYKFLTKPWDDERIRGHIAEAFRQKEMADENKRLAREVESANGRLEQLNQQLQQSLQQQNDQSSILQRSADSAREILDGLPAAIIGIDPEGLIAFVGGGASQIVPQLSCSIGRTAATALPPCLVRLLQENQASGRHVDCGDRQFHGVVRTLDSSGTLRGSLIVLVPVESTCTETLS